MVVARSLSEVTEFEHTGTLFYLRQLPHRVMLRLSSLGQEDQVELLLRSGIQGWKNMQGDDSIVSATLADSVIAVCEVKQALTLASMDALPFAMIGELSQAVLQANQLSDEQAKN